MASKPPFQVEDQTDEDFFDKLVDDDAEVDFKESTKTSSLDSMRPPITQGNESSEIKAFANLSFNEESSEKDCNKVGTSEKVQEDIKVIKGGNNVESIADEKDTVLEASNSYDLASVSAKKENSKVLEPASSLEVSSISEANNRISGAEVSSDTGVSKSTGSGVKGVKEVQWSAFHADSAQNEDNGFGSFSDFFTQLGEDTGDPNINVVSSSLTETAKVSSGNDTLKSVENSNHGLYKEGYSYDVGIQQNTEGQGLNTTEYWESVYPGWKFDATTGQWYQIDGYGADPNAQGNTMSGSTSNWVAADRSTDISYLQHNVQSVTGTMSKVGTTGSLTNWNQATDQISNIGDASHWNQVSHVTNTRGSLTDWNQESSANDAYPSHMVFYPQYPGWYFDTIAQEWRSLDSYSMSSNAQGQDQLKQNGFASSEPISYHENQNTFVAHTQDGNQSTKMLGTPGQDLVWPGPINSYNNQDSGTWQHKTFLKSKSRSNYGQNQQMPSQYGQDSSRTNHAVNQMSKDSGVTVSPYEKTNKFQDDFSAIPGPQGFASVGNFDHQDNTSTMDTSERNLVSNGYFGNQNSVNFPQKLDQGFHHFSYAPSTGRSSAGRPAHALVRFGFGGKLIVAKQDISMGTSSFGSQNPAGSSITVFNLMELAEKADGSSFVLGASDYLHTLCRQSFPGPLNGGGGGVKELNRWFEERFRTSDPPNMDNQKGEVMRLLLSLLKLSCQYYGKLRSPIGSDTAKESDAPETTVARLFASSKTNAAHFRQYGAIVHCLQTLPSEGQMQVTAAEVQNLLVSGKKQEALTCAQEGQLWGPALVLAAQLGDQFYVDTVKQMSLRQLVPGSPLRTLCLLISGQPADLFSFNASADSGMFGSENINQQLEQVGMNNMLDDWEENLAVITANRTKNDGLVLIHLGDCLWKDKADVVAAHICYLVAEANFEPYSDTARLCLVGTDHWKFPRTYASPEAIQRTEIYEYSKVLGNSQFVLLPFQPYKLIYASMLAEVGRLSDASRYCQSILKSLKTGRSLEVEALRNSVSALEERIKIHQQGGFTTNLDPSKLVGRLLNLIDSTANRVVGGPPFSVPSTSGASASISEQNQTPSRVQTSQSTMAMSSLMNSAPPDPTREWAPNSNRKPKHNRSVSEPDIGRSPRQHQVDSSEGSAHSQEEKSGGVSRLGRFGFGSQLLQKTVGLVLGPRQGRQAKLGEKNKFYYDEKLKRWVEEGAEPPAEETNVSAPPTNSALQSSSPYNMKTALSNEGTANDGSPDSKTPPLERGSGMPPLPPTSNQYSARGRTSARSRYVDPFNNTGGVQTNLFQSPSVSSTKPATSLNTKFFVPTPVNYQENIDNSTDSNQDNSLSDDDVSKANLHDSFMSPAPSSTMALQRFGSMDDMSAKATTTSDSSSAQHYRRASWSGSFGENVNPLSRTAETLGDVSRMPPPFMPPDPLTHSMNGGSFGEELQEVEL